MPHLPSFLLFLPASVCYSLITRGNHNHNTHNTHTHPQAPP